MTVWKSNFTEQRLCACTDEPLKSLTGRTFCFLALLKFSSPLACRREGSFRKYFFGHPFGRSKEYDLRNVVSVGFCDGRQLLGNDDGADSDVSSVKGQFYQFAGYVFYGLRGGAIVENYETLGVLSVVDDHF